MNVLAAVVVAMSQGQLRIALLSLVVVAGCALVGLAAYLGGWHR